MRLLLLSFCLLCPTLLTAQILQGIIVDEESGEPLPKVWIHNLASGESAISGLTGSFSITAQKEDNLQFSLIGYTSKSLLPASEQYLRVTLSKKRVAIDTIVIRPGLTPYQEDSLNRRAIYGKKVDEKPAKFKFNKPNRLYGGTSSFNAPVSSLFQKKTKKYKRLKAFQDRFKNSERQLFVDTRYTPALVQKLTGLQDDSLARFMNQYPMDYDYARAASDLELMMWIKHNYKEWLKQPPAKKGE